MILIIHKKSQKLIKALHNSEELKLEKLSLLTVFWHLAKEFPEEIIAWCEEGLYDSLDLKNWSEVFHHDRIIASYAVKTKFLPESIGYIDQLPFVNINREVQYATWRMSTDVGGIKGETLLKFRDIFGDIKDLRFLLNSIAKLGQQNGLFCYSAPQLLKKESRIPTGDNKINSTAGIVQTFSFVYAHYKTFRLFLLFWCYLKYERSFPLWALIRALFNKKYFKENIDLSSVSLKSAKQKKLKNTIDVIIPTLGRREFLLQVLEDLKIQSLLPKKVIVVEQNSEPGSQSELPELITKTWPFEVIHHFTHQTGACNARNIALEKVSANWVFFADDDIRIEPDLLCKALGEMNRLGISSINMNCKQKGEQTIFSKIKQWGSFGSGTSVVRRVFTKACEFSRIYEHGYGEDADFGMQLRELGCDIIYHPKIEILHLKAPIGGFRQKPILAWEKELPIPKPSPTLMAFALKHYTPQQIKGFKASLFLKNYNIQSTKNPFIYLKSMRMRWKKSEEWARKSIQSQENIT